MAVYQGAIFIYTWNGGSIDGLTIDHNDVWWNPFNNAPALLNNATIAAGSAVFRENHIDSTAPWIIGSTSSLSLSQNHYRYYGLGNPEFHLGGKSFDNLRSLQDATHQEDGSDETPLALRLWPPSQQKTSGIWKLSCTLPVSLNAQGLLDDDALRQIIVLRSQAEQYVASRLEVSLDLTSPDSRLFDSAAFRNAVTDLDLRHMTVTHTASASGLQIALQAPSGVTVQRWNVPVGPVALGRVLRESLGEPFYDQMGNHDDDK
jgi:hypothetical protein